jgi:AraC-like DNA-binding protein
MTELLTSDQIFIRKLTEIVHANLGNENLGVKELAHESGLSVYSLSRKLYSIKKKRISQFIREVRLKQSMEMLQNETFTVSEVAYKVGFGSPAYFNKCFREYFGYTPGEVRNADPNTNHQDAQIQDFDENKPSKSLIRNFLLTLPGILILVLISGTAGFFIYKNIQNSEGTNYLISSDGRISIVVMPFQNMTNDTTWNVWQEAIQGSLISLLSNSKELNVRQRENINTLLQNRDMIKYASVSYYHTSYY